MPETPFLTARWENLCLLTYRIDPALVRPYLAAGLEPDLRDGGAFASLVTFDFLDTRVMGVPWPGFRNFPEVNLRLYVRQGDRRGVVFVREFVPQSLVAWVARAIYNEPYRATRIRNFDRSTASSVERTTELEWAGRSHRLTVRARREPFLPAPESDEHFFKEHRWGFGRSREGKPLVYKVLHPQWRVYPIESWALDWDWASVYGPEWGFLKNEEPVSAVLAEGSRVAVFPKSLLP